MQLDNRAKEMRGLRKQKLATRLRDLAHPLGKYQVVKGFRETDERH